LETLDVSNNIALAELHCHDNYMGNNPYIGVAGWSSEQLGDPIHRDDSGSNFLYFPQRSSSSSSPTPSPAAPSPTPIPVVHTIWTGHFDYSISGSHYEYGGAASGETGNVNHRYMGFALSNPRIDYRTLTLEFENAIGNSFPSMNQSLIRFFDFPLLNAEGNRIFPKNLEGVSQTVYIDLHHFPELNIANNSLAHFHRNGDLGPNGQGILTHVFLTNTLPGSSPGGMPTPVPNLITNTIWSGSLDYSIDGNYYAYGGPASGETGSVNHRFMGFALTNPSVDYRTLTLEFTNSIGNTLPDGNRQLIRLYDFTLLDANGNALPRNLGGTTQTVYIDLHQYFGLNIANNNLAHFHRNGNLGPNGQGIVTRIFLSNVLPGSTGQHPTASPTPTPAPTQGVHIVWVGEFEYSVDGGQYEFGGPANTPTTGGSGSIAVGTPGATGNINHRFMGFSLTNPSVDYRTLTLEFETNLGDSLPTGNKRLIRLFDFTLLDTGGNQLPRNLQGTSQTAYIDLWQYPGLNIADNILVNFHKNGNLAPNGQGILTQIFLVSELPGLSSSVLPTPSPMPQTHEIWAGNLNYSINDNQYHYAGATSGSTGGTNHRFMGFELTVPEITWKNLTLEFSSNIGSALPDNNKRLLRLFDFDLMDANGNQLPESLNGVSQVVYIDLRQYQGLNIAHNSLAHFHINGNLAPNGQGVLTRVFLISDLPG
jgi:hypothetical protein